MKQMSRREVIPDDLMIREFPSALDAMEGNYVSTLGRPRAL
jgi:hypothetical protein